MLRISGLRISGLRISGLRLGGWGENTIRRLRDVWMSGDAAMRAYAGICADMRGCHDADAGIFGYRHMETKRGGIPPKPRLYL